MPLQSPDWFALITDLIYLGVPMKEISRRMGATASESALRNYRAGAQPLYVRGEALIRLWMETTGKQAEDMPRCAFVRGHRAERRPAQNLRVRQHSGIDRLAKAIGG